MWVKSSLRYFVGCIFLAYFLSAQAESGREDPTQPDGAAPEGGVINKSAVMSHRLLGIYSVNQGKRTVFIDHERLRLHDKLVNGDQLVEIGKGYVVLKDADNQKHRVALLNLVNEHE